MQQLPTFNFGLTKIFFFIYRTLSMRQKTKNYRIRGSNAQKNLILFYFPSHIPIWVWFVQKTRAKNSHAWAPLNKYHDTRQLHRRYCVFVSVFRIHRILMFLGLPDPDPLVRGTDLDPALDPSIIKQN
jgi:hypothetical protein